MTPPADERDHNAPLMAFGLIETIGAVGGIEAADAALKAANVRLVGKEYADAGLHLIKVIGEVAAVRQAVEAGAAAAKRCGMLAGTHVIPRPDIQLEQWVFARVDDPKAMAFHRNLEQEAAPRGVTIPPAPNLPPNELPPGYEDLPVRELRTLVRHLQGFTLQGREVSMANKEELLAAIEAWKRTQGH